MHTPEEAAGLWCPMVRIARHETIEHRTGYQESYRDQAVIVGGCNTDALGSTRVPASCRCIADRCAMWRWHLPWKLQKGGLFRIAKWVPDGEPTQGYCGIAGKQDVVA